MVGEATIPFCNKHWYALPASLRIRLGETSWNPDNAEFERLMLMSINRLNGAE